MRTKNSNSHYANLLPRPKGWDNRALAWFLSTIFRMLEEEAAQNPNFYFFD